MRTYKIHYNLLEPTSAIQPGVAGIEIQPPLELPAIEGIRAALTTSSPDHGSAGPVRWAELTRQDNKGTAFAFGLRSNQLSTPHAVAKRLGALINPCGLHRIEYRSHQQGSNS